MNELVKPVATPEVEKFLGLWDEYYKAANGCRLESMSIWGRDYLSIVGLNEAKADENVAAMNVVLELGEAMKLMGEAVAEAATEYHSALYAYNEAVKAAEDKPRRDWEAAKETLVRTFEKEKRSLSIKLGKLSSKRWSGTDAEKAYHAEQYELLSARQDVVELMLSDVQWMRYSDYEGTVFSDELVAQAAGSRRERINQLIAEFDANRLQEVDA